ncbi:hypothetical protein Emed_000242 [Eimeria media]
METSQQAEAPRVEERRAEKRRDNSPSLTSLFAHHPLHYVYALTRSRCKDLDEGYQTLYDQLQVERQCLQCFSEMLPALAPHPSYLPSQSPSPASGKEAKQEQQGGQEEEDLDEDNMPIEDKDFLWQRATRRVLLHRSRHVAFLSRHLDTPFSASMMELAASRPWLVYWMVHGLCLLDAFPRSAYADKILETLDSCWDSAGGGGWGGGEGQQAHLACTYAAAATLVEAGGAYCAIATASMLRILTDELMEGLAEYITSCQGYDGGIAGEPGLESHGGYTYCGLAALCIMGKASMLDLHGLLHWAACRQMGFEGGFQGRTAKLVDSCYSFWLGAIFPLVAEAFRQEQKEYPLTHCWMSSKHLQQYILCCCQTEKGGIEDKPGKGADLYHTCYALSGLSIAQHAAAHGELGKPPYVFGKRSNNLLERTDPFYNVCSKHLEECRMQLDNVPVFQAPNNTQKGTEGKGPAVYAQWIAEFNRPPVEVADDLNDGDWMDPESEVESV